VSRHFDVTQEQEKSLRINLGIDNSGNMSPEVLVTASVKVRKQVNEGR